MKKTIVSILIILSFFISCKKNADLNLNKTVKPCFNLEKIIVVNLNEGSMTFFKIYLKNNNENSVILLDNNLSKFQAKRVETIKKGFYLRNIKNDSIIMLNIDNDYFYEIGGKTNGFCFLGTSNLKNSFTQKDSIKLRKLLLNYTLEYNGKDLNLNKIKKSPYTSQSYYKRFIERKEKLIPFNDSLFISIPVNIKIKYLNYMPITKMEWDNL